MRKPMDMQPESLATFAASARDRAAKKPDDIGLTATPETAPLRGDLSKEEKTAADILNEGATGKPKGGKEEARDLPDRTSDHAQQLARH